MGDVVDVNVASHDSKLTVRVEDISRITHKILRSKIHLAKSRGGGHPEEDLPRQTP